MADSRYSVLRILRCSFIILMCNGQMYGQQTGQFVDNSQQTHIPFTITNYNTKHGLPQNQIVYIAPKKNGELILSTANGIVSYDGYSFSNFIKNKDYKRYIHTKLLYSEKYKRLYGLTLGGGFNQISPTFKHFNKFQSVCLYNDKIYGVLRNGTICVFDPKDNSIKTLIKTGIQLASPVYYNGKHFFVGGKGGLFIVDPKSKKVTRISSCEVGDFRENPYTGEIYMYNRTQAFKILKNNRVVQLIPGMNTSGFTFYDMAFTPDDETYISSTKGLIYIGYGYSKLYNEKDFLPSEDIQSIYYSETENCIFAGTTNLGLLKLNIKNCASLIHLTELIKTSLSSIIITSSGKTLVCSSDRSVYSLSTDGATPYVKVSMPPACMAEIDKEIWVGTWGDGVFRFRDQQLIGQITAPQVKSTVVHSIFRDSKGNYWLGNQFGISMGKTPQAIRPFLRKEITKDIITIYQKKNGNLLFGGTDGLYELDKFNKIIHHWGQKEGLSCKEVRSIYEDKEGKIWLGTYDGGLFCMEKGKMTSINSMENCMLNEDVFTVAKDFNGNIYMTSNNGLWVVNEKKLNDFYHQKTEYLIPFIYGNESGIMNTEFNGGFQNNFAHSKYDYFYFPSIEGLVTVNPEKPVFRKLMPEIRWMKINNRLVDSEKHVFDRTTNTIEFNFHVANFSSKFNVFYQYQLEGPNTSSHWGAMQRNGKVHISFLPPGDYTIRMRALDANNDPNPKVLTYRFSIKPYYYETWWFRILVLFMFLLIISSIIRYQITTRRKKEIRENNMNNNMLELKLKAIQSKMNPHFVFNTLNNIQYLIASKRNDEAEHTLNEFSQLLRKFLHQSNRSFVRLKDELAIISNYLSVEQIRFKGSLEIIIESNPECGKLVIPTLLLQPVVENAVKHGLAHKDNNKKLMITTSCDSDMLMITIDDNGIGRKASEQINRFRDKHVSHGEALVEEKIDVIYQKYGIQITYDIIDKPAPETGTVIVFNIPKIDDQLLNY